MAFHRSLKWRVCETHYSMSISRTCARLPTASRLYHSGRFGLIWVNPASYLR